MDNEEGINQSRVYRSKFGLPELSTRWIIVWVLAFFVLALIAVILQISIISTFSQQNPFSYGMFLIFIPIIAYLTVDASKGRDPPTITNSRMTVFFILGMLGFTAVAISQTMYTASWNVFNFLFLIPILISIIAFKIPRRELGFRGNISDVKIAVLIGAAYGTLVFISIGYNELLGLLSWTEPWDLNITLVLPQSILFAIFFILIFVAIPEEFFFRVILQSSISERLGETKGLLLASLIFGLFHLPANFLAYLSFSGNVQLSFIAALILAFIAQSQVGLVLGVAWHRTRSLILPVTIHAVHDVVELLPLFIGISLGLIYF